jgi:hypothetical protein
MDLPGAILHRPTLVPEGRRVILHRPALVPEGHRVILHPRGRAQGDRPVANVS